MSVHAFLSCVREDTERVDRLQRQLELGGIPVWQDRDAPAVVTSKNVSFVHEGKGLFRAVLPVSDDEERGSARVFALCQGDVDFH